MYYSNGREIVHEYELEETFRQTMNELGEVDVLGLSYPLADVLREVDPDRYREAWNNWLSSEGWNESHDEEDA